MTKDRFREILREYGYRPQDINALWRTRPHDDLDETALRRISAKFRGNLVLDTIPEDFEEDQP